MVTKKNLLFSKNTLTIFESGSVTDARENWLVLKSLLALKLNFFWQMGMVLYTLQTFSPGDHAPCNPFRHSR